MTPSYKIREATGNDLPFIYDTWLNSCKHDSFNGKACRTSVYFEGQKKVIDRILQDESTKVLIAHMPEKEDVIFGYIVFQPSILHFIFVKAAFQRFHIGTKLFSYAFPPEIRTVEYTHRTRIGAKIAGKYNNLDHNPYILINRGE